MSDPTNDFAITRPTLNGTLIEPMYSGVLSYMRRKYQKDLDGIDVAVSGIPYDAATTNRPGARFGPRAIREASTQLAWARAWPWAVDPFDQLAVIDYGDCPIDYSAPDKIPAAIEAHAKTILDSGTAMLTFGGDHFVTYPLLRAHAAKHGPVSLIHFDAHTDTWPDEGGTLDHGTMFYRAVNEGLIVPEHSAQIGIRTTNDDTRGLNIFDARWVHQNGPEKTAEAVRALVGERPVYLTFDIDGLDPAYAPGTGTPVVGGLSTYQAQEILIGLTGIHLIGMDVVEVAPAYDTSDITALAGASMALHMLCLYAACQAK